MTPKRRRLVLVLLGLLSIGAGTMLILQRFQDNLVYFYSPSDLANSPPDLGTRIRVGGLVEEGSVSVSQDTQPTIRFSLTDGPHSMTLLYTGLLPSLFREGQGIIAEGVLDQNGLFIADSLLAKHDENYMPPEVKDALKKSGHWEGE